MELSANEASVQPPVVAVHVPVPSLVAALPVVAAARLLMRSLE